jgi:coatomer subunit beta
MRFSELPGTNDLSNSFRAEAMLTMSSIIRVGQSQFVKTRIDEDSIDRIMTCFRALAEFKQIKDIEDVFLKETKSAYTTMLAAEDTVRKAKAREERNKSAIQVDDVISIRQLVKKGTDKGKDEVPFSIIHTDNSRNWICRRPFWMVRQRLTICHPN